jgi:hypothetical protein
MKLGNLKSEVRHLNPRSLARMTLELELTQFRGRVLV